MKSTLKSWKNYKGKNSLKDFISYFNKQWIDSSFKNWQIFCTPAGYPMTNSPIESYNNIIKKFFTNRVKYNILPVCEIFETQIIIQSRSIREFPRLIPIPLSIKKTAITQVCTDKITESLNELDDNGNPIHVYDHRYKIAFSSECFCIDCCYCSCCYFVDKGICLHLVACLFKNKVNYPGLLTSKYFVNRPKAGRKRKAGPCLELD